MPGTTLATRRVAVLFSSFLLAAGLAACGSDPSEAPAATPTASSSATTTGLALDDGWVKAVGVSTAGMGPMSAMFGTLRNTTGADLTVTGGSSPAAGVVELHETVKNDSGQMQMQPKQGGFVIPAGGTHVLEPGGDHIMLMGLTSSLESGTTTTVTLRTSSGDVVLVVPVRAFPGAEESYAPTPSS